MRDPAAMMRGIQALQRQAEAWVAAYRTSLAEHGLGFGPEDLALVASQAAAHPTPPGGIGPPASLEAQQDAAAMAAQAMSIEYPEHGIDPADPRLAARHGVSMVAWAVACRAIGWSPDPMLRDRVLAALGLPAASWAAASDEWTAAVSNDLLLATFYGQLFLQADPLPARA